MRIFITGATGFIGTNLVKKAIASGHEVMAFGRNKSQLTRLSHMGAKTICGDMADISKWAKYLRSSHTLIHLAASRANWGDTKQIYRLNSEVVGELFRQGKGLKHVIFISSVYAMGDLKKLPASERDGYGATDLYGKSKLLGEGVAKAASQLFKIPLTILRPAIVYGLGDSQDSFMLKLVSSLKKGRLPLVGGGNNLVHLVYIDDLIHGIMQAVRKGGTGQTYIIASAEPIKFKELVQIVKQMLNKDYPDRNLPYLPFKLMAMIVPPVFALIGLEPPLTPIKLKAIAGNWSYSIQKAKKELGFKPKTNYKQGLKMAIIDYLN